MLLSAANEAIHAVHQVHVRPYWPVLSCRSPLSIGVVTNNCLSAETLVKAEAAYETDIRP